MQIKQFAADASVKQAVTSWLRTFDSDFFYAWIEALVPQWNRCLNVNGDHKLAACHMYFEDSIRMFIILLLKLLSTLTYPWFLFPKFCSRFSTALFSLFCEFLLSGSCLCLQENSYSLLFLYVTPIAELRLCAVICYTAIGVRANYSYMLHCYRSHRLLLLYITLYKTYMWTSIYGQPCINS